MQESLECQEFPFGGSQSTASSQMIPAFPTFSLEKGSMVQGKQRGWSGNEVGCEQGELLEWGWEKERKGERNERGRGGKEGNGGEKERKKERERGMEKKRGKVKKRRKWESKKQTGEIIERGRKEKGERKER